MTRLSATVRGLGLALVCQLAVGCVPPPGAGDQSQAERYFSAGKSRLQQQDFKGAIALFERSLLADPQLADSHYQMGMIFDRELNSPEKALYHYIRALELNPNLPGADLISNRLTVVRMTLARSATPTLPSPHLAAEIDRLQRDLEALRTERDQTAAENADLKQRLALLQRPPVQAGPSPLTVQAISDPVASGTGRPAGGENVSAGAPEVIQGNVGASSGSVRSYVIQRGDTLYGLSRRFQVSQSELAAVNPGLSERNFPAGRTIQVPVK